MPCQGVTSDHTGWYWCITLGGEASVFVDVIDDHAEKEKHAEIKTEATADVVGITEVIDNLEVSIKHIEYTTAAAISEQPTTEEVSEKVDKNVEEYSLPRTASPPPLTWWPWCSSTCSQYTGSYRTSWRGWTMWSRN